MKSRFKPSRRLRGDLFSLAVAASVPVVLLAVFPCAALRPFAAVPSGSALATCAFVTLTPEDERRALAMARAAWQLDRGTARHARIDLFEDTLPPMSPHPALGFSAMPASDWGRLGTYVPDLLPPSQAAAAPAAIPPQPDADAPCQTFPREELLRLN